jgi:hypothetical protein
MKRFFNWLGNFTEWLGIVILIVVPTGFFFWLIYKVCAGVFHLLDKLIDKL